MKIYRNLLELLTIVLLLTTMMVNSKDYDDYDDCFHDDECDFETDFQPMDKPEPSYECYNMEIEECPFALRHNLTLLEKKLLQTKDGCMIRKKIKNEHLELKATQELLKDANRKYCFLVYIEAEALGKILLRDDVVLGLSENTIDFMIKSPLMAQTFGQLPVTTIAKMINANPKIAASFPTNTEFPAKKLMERLMVNKEYLLALKVEVLAYLAGTPFHRLLSPAVISVVLKIHPSLPRHFSKETINFMVNSSSMIRTLEHLPVTTVAKMINYNPRIAESLTTSGEFPAKRLMERLMINEEYLRALKVEVIAYLAGTPFHSLLSPEVIRLILKIYPKLTQYFSEKTIDVMVNSVTMARTLEQLPVATIAKMINANPKIAESFPTNRDFPAKILMERLMRNEEYLSKLKVEVLAHLAGTPFLSLLSPEVIRLILKIHPTLPQHFSEKTIDFMVNSQWMARTVEKLPVTTIAQMINAKPKIAERFPINREFPAKKLIEKLMLNEEFLRAIKVEVLAYLAGTNFHKLLSAEVIQLVIKTHPTLAWHFSENTIDVIVNSQSMARAFERLPVTTIAKMINVNPKIAESFPTNKEFPAKKLMNRIMRNEEYLRALKVEVLAYLTETPFLKLLSTDIIHLILKVHPNLTLHLSSNGKSIIPKYIHEPSFLEKLDCRAIRNIVSDLEFVNSLKGRDLKKLLGTKRIWDCLTVKDVRRVSKKAKLGNKVTFTDIYNAGQLMSKHKLLDKTVIWNMLRYQFPKLARNRVANFFY